MNDIKQAFLDSAESAKKDIELRIKLNQAYYKGYKEGVEDGIKFEKNKDKIVEMLNKFLNKQ